MRICTLSNINLKYIFVSIKFYKLIDVVIFYYLKNKISHLKQITTDNYMYIYFIILYVEEKDCDLDLTFMRKQDGQIWLRWDYHLVIFSVWLRENIHEFLKITWKSDIEKTPSLKRKKSLNQKKKKCWVETHHKVLHYTATYTF